MKKILVTGSRKWPSKYLVALALSWFRDDSEDNLTVVVQGFAAGADKMAHQVAEDTPGFISVPVPADWQKHVSCKCRNQKPGTTCKAAGVIRNQRMLDDHPDIDLALAFPYGEAKGTRDMMERVNKAGIPMVVFDLFPGGK